VPCPVACRGVFFLRKKPLAILLSLDSNWKNAFALYTEYVASIQTQKKTRIVLTGFMGSGKSTVGPQLAERLGWRFVDADEAIETAAGCTIADLFRTHGEAYFRQLEHETIARLAAEEQLVLSLGGGAIETEATRTLLLADAPTLLVHLEVELATTLRRCRGTEGTRPILADHANLERRYRSRLPLYRTAHISIAVDALTPRQVVEAVAHAAGLA
jgi:shikimate kinase